MILTLAVTSVLALLFLPQIASSKALVAAEGTGMKAVPTLGSASAFPSGGAGVVAGFGQVRPMTVSYGGDPTSVIGGVHWGSWGQPIAYGEGVSTWDWPGTEVAANGPSGARIAAYDLGSCDGHAAYLAVQWWFPEDGQTFDADAWHQNLCTGKFVGARPPSSHACSNLQVGGHTVESIEASGMTCAQVDALLEAIPFITFIPEHHYVVRGFRCAEGLSGPYGCGVGDRQVAWFTT